MTTTLIAISAVVTISAALSLGSMGIFYFIRKRGSKRTRLAGKTRCEFIIEEDISNGRELNKMPAISYSRHDSAPTDYHYVTEHVNIEPIDVDTSLKRMTCCQCLDDCSDNNCECIRFSKCGQYYDSSGRLKLDYLTNSCTAIRECNIACKCNRKLCKNMVIQGGCQLHLVLFKTKSRGWGVRTLENIKRGTFIGVYSGELVSVSSSQCRQDDTYLFNLANSIMRYDSRPSESQRPSQELAEQPQQPQELAEDGQEVVEICSANEKGEVLSDVMDIDQLSAETGETTNSQRVVEGNEDKDAFKRIEAQGFEQEYAQDSIDEDWEYVSDGEQGLATEHEQVNEQETSAAEAETGPETEPGPEMGEGANGEGKEGELERVQEEDYICDAKFYGNFTRFINHSCEPNVIGIRTFTAHQDNRFPYISFFANQDIAAGEELTLNYGDNYWLVKCKRDKVFCLCKKPSCKFTKKTLNQTLKLYCEQRQIAFNYHQ